MVASNAGRRRAQPNGSSFHRGGIATHLIAAIADSPGRRFALARGIAIFQCGLQDPRPRSRCSDHRQRTRYSRTRSSAAHLRAGTLAETERHGAGRAWRWNGPHRLRRTASVAMSTRSNAISISRTRPQARRARRFVLCLRNDGYKASLELRKFYVALPDADAEAHEQLRVVDESGEDYLFPTSYFAPLEISPALRRRLLRAV